MEDWKEIISGIFAVSIVVFMIWASINIFTNLDENEKFCDEADLNNTINATQYFDFGGWCCYRNHYREEHCMSFEILKGE